ncbi:chloride channel protein [Pseudomonas segetis]|uniref:H+/Cl- antiporter ClcA n=1 Tax=Pseudomonas segetis TaxID=298908 RepID=A0A239D1N6_9PSED|nr:chloride channel protein [Pseudomonas segetis]SNS26207.1 H+/Cl- antiporter ClcA [Pseudomonas segetis]
MPSNSEAQKTPTARQRFRARRRYLRVLRQRLAFWVGALLVGLVALAFAWLADEANIYFQRMLNHSNYWPWLVTPLGFAALAWATQGWFRNAKGSGIPQVIATLERPSSRFRNRVLSLPIAAVKMVLSVAGLLVGASIGREGPTVHVGAALMYTFGRRLGLQARSAGSGLIIAGGAAGIAAAFNTPLAGVVFAIEELSHRFEQSLNGLVLTAVLIGGMVTLGLMGHYSYFGQLSAELPLSRDWLAVLVCGAAGGLAGGLYCRLVLPAKLGPLALMAAWRARRPVIFAGICGLVMALLGLISGQHVFGTGYAETRAILEGQPVTDASFVIWKFLANVVSYLAGIPGGLFSPSLAVGASFAPWVTDWIPGISLQAAGLIGMAAYLAGVTRTPLTATVITIELSHSQDMALPILAASLLASAISGRISPVPLYRALATQLLDVERESIAKRRSKRQQDSAAAAAQAQTKQAPEPGNPEQGQP